MTEIKVREGESIEQALRRFNQKVYDAGIMEELKKREYYKPPSEIKKKKRKELEWRFSQHHR